MAPPDIPERPAPLPEQDLQRLHDLMEQLAAAPNKREARPLAKAVRQEVRALRALLPPLTASALARTARDAEAASGTLIDKSWRLAELQESWELLLRLMAGV